MMHKLDVPETRHENFIAALYQFLMPAIAISADGTHERLPGRPLLGQLDEHLLSELDMLYQAPPVPNMVGPRRGMCKNVHQVQRPPLPSPIPNPAQHQPRVPFVPPPSGSTARRKRTRKTKEESGREDNHPTKSRKRTSKTLHFDSLKRLRKFQLLEL